MTECTRNYWPDLVRTGQAIAVMTPYGQKMKQQHGYLLPNSYAVTTDRLIYPIPFREIQVNTALTQNPGYLFFTITIKLFTDEMANNR